MAKVTITIEDSPGGKVKCVSKPTFEEIMKMNISGEDLTSAEAYAVFMLNQLRKESNRQGPTKILIPRIRGI